MGRGGEGERGRWGDGECGKIFLYTIERFSSYTNFLACLLYINPRVTVSPRHRVISICSQYK
ncbi:MAG: hypothetical protein F6K16_26985 [Symploca sp. SIO2B6]|nr:hypothetical protein [Symploca sp. SIO2B6]